jgi:hypothetical protein
MDISNECEPEIRKPGKPFGHPVLSVSSRSCGENGRPRKRGGTRVWHPGVCNNPEELAACKL